MNGITAPAILVNGPFDSQLCFVNVRCSQVCLQEMSGERHFYVRHPYVFRRTRRGRAAIFDYVGTTPVRQGWPFQLILVPRSETPDQHEASGS